MNRYDALHREAFRTPRLRYRYAHAALVRGARQGGSVSKGAPTET